jgi:hypothetical protein
MGVTVFSRRVRVMIVAPLVETHLLDPPSASAPQKYSVHEESEYEILRHKWIESERAGYDLGEAAVRQWVRDHWRGYLRARWLEHLQGSRFWIELDRGDYGLLKRAFHDDRALLDKILDRLKSGCENLDVICWASETDIPSERVLRILDALDINSRRLLHRFETRMVESHHAQNAGLS